MRHDFIENMFRAMFPNGTTVNNFISQYKDPAEILIRNYFNETYKVVGEVNFSGLATEYSFKETTVVSGSELTRPFLGNLVPAIQDLLSRTLINRMRPAGGVFGNPQVSGISIAPSGNNLVITADITAESGLLYDISGIPPVQFFDRNIKGAVIFFDALSGTNFVVQHSLNSTNLVTTMYSGNNLMIPDDIQPSGNNHIAINLCIAASGFINIISV